MDKTVVVLGPNKGKPAWKIHVNSWGGCRAPRLGNKYGGGWLAALDEQLEPILPEGHSPAEMTTEELLPNIHEWAKGKHKALVKV